LTWLYALYQVGGLAQRASSPTEKNGHDVGR
jgi:hypothetical protein